MIPLCAIIGCLFLLRVIFFIREQRQTQEEKQKHHVVRAIRKFNDDH